MRAGQLALIAVAHLALHAGAQAWPGRDGSARAQFQRANPCPATGKKTSACPGWEIDHIKPLKCGGTDMLDNMQWLTISDHKAKTKAEAKLCLKHGRKQVA